MPAYAWKIFLVNAIEMVSIIPSNAASEAQTFRNHHHLANSHRTQRRHLVFISERVSCIHVWRRSFSVVPIHRTVHHKNESWTDGISLSRKIQMCSCVKCTRVSGNFPLMLSISHLSRLMTKPTKWYVRPAKTQISLGILPVWSESSPSAWRKLGSLATHWAHSEDSDQTGWSESLLAHFHFVGFVSWHYSRYGLNQITLMLPVN